MDTEGKETQTEQSPDLATDGEELLKATEQFIRTLFRAGVNLAFMPINMLPQEPREHFKTAGREFTRGLSTLVREIADEVEKVTEPDKEEPTKTVD